MNTFLLNHRISYHLIEEMKLFIQTNYVIRLYENGIVITTILCSMYYVIVKLYHWYMYIGKEIFKVFPNNQGWEQSISKLNGYRQYFTINSQLHTDGILLESFSYRFVYLSIWLAQFRFFDIEYSFSKHQYTCIFDVRQIKFATGRPRLNSYRVLRWCTVRSRLPFPLITIIVIFGWCNWLNLLIFSIDLSWCGGSIKKTKWPEARAWGVFFCDQIGLFRSITFSCYLSYSPQGRWVIDFSFDWFFCNCRGLRLRPCAGGQTTRPSRVLRQSKSSILSGWVRR